MRTARFGRESQPERERPPGRATGGRAAGAVVHGGPISRTGGGAARVRCQGGSRRAFALPEAIGRERRAARGAPVAEWTTRSRPSRREVPPDRLLPVGVDRGSVSSGTAGVRSLPGSHGRDQVQKESLLHSAQERQQQELREPQPVRAGHCGRRWPAAGAKTPGPALLLLPGQAAGAATPGQHGDPVRRADHLPRRTPPRTSSRCALFIVRRR
mmetsp:Transcript_34140/g.85686  ORF Transcript_34140/g.85686 Transcript_34140/m.85686 type:complete len:213 (-) Transcript_34140:486-1124(-)